LSKNIRKAAVLLLALLFLCGCAQPDAPAKAAAEMTLLPASPDSLETEPQEEPMLKIEIGNTILSAQFADTRAAEELKNDLKNGSITISVSNYGGWEKVGSLPWSLPRDDVQTTAVPGDIMLYNGSSIVLFYGNNSWAYTRLGTIVDADEETLRAALSGEETELVLSLM